MVYQERISELSKDTNIKNRRYAAYVFKYFLDFPDKKEALADLHRLTLDEDSIVRQNAARAFILFSDFPDKKEAWADLHRLTLDEDSVVRQNAARAFILFSDFPDKKEALADLHRLTLDEDSVVKQNAAFAFRIFSDFPDKKEALADLHRLTLDENSVVRQNAAIAFQTSFSDFPDKKEAFADLHRLTLDEDSVVRQNAAFAFQTSFSDFPDKKEAFADLHRLTLDENSVVKQNAAFAFRIFSDFPDKKEALADLHRLTLDGNSVVRQNAAIAFQTSFSDFPDKKEAWADLHRLTLDEDSVVKQNAAFAFRIFSDFPDKKEAFADLHRLTLDENSVVRQNAAIAFQTSFSDFPDKKEAFADLHRLTLDENSVVRQNAAFVIHYVYEKASQKDKLLEWLSNLKEDTSDRVKAISCYSLARIYVYESLKAGTEQEFKEKYTKAIQFFKEAYNYRKWDIIEFCFAVHSLFYKILSGDIKNVKDIRNNISLLRNKSTKTEERQYLLEILESLGNVLEESLIAKKSGKDAWLYREKVLPYCNRADELIKILKHKGIREIAIKAKTKVEEEYLDVLKLLDKVNYLIDKPKTLEEQFLPTLKGFCELFPEPEIRDKIKQDLNKIQNENDPNIRIRLEIQQLKYIQYMLEMDLKAKEREIRHKDEIIDIKDKESKKGWSLLKIILPQKIPELKGIESRSIAIKILENLAISFTISGVIWGIIYALLSEKKYPTAMRESLIIAGIFFIFIFIIYLIKKR